MTDVTGNKLRDLRKAFRLSTALLAEILGCAPSTVYRWEARGDEDLLAAPGELRIFFVMEAIAERGWAEAAGGRARTAAMRGGGLRGLHELLLAHYATEDEAA